MALARDPVELVLAALLGTLSPGGQEVGPFAAIEQAAISEVTTGTPTRRFATYNIVGAFVVPSEALFWGYGCVGLGLAAIYAVTFSRGEHVRRQASSPASAVLRSRALHLGIVERLTLLFGLDALAGGFALQSFIAYWLHLRFGADAHALGVLFFGTNVLAALSLLVAARLAEVIGLLKTMVVTHLPSNVLLLVVPLMPSFPLAAIVLLARAALSQMDVPTRQAYTMALVPPAERTRAAGLTAAVRPCRRRRGSRACRPRARGCRLRAPVLSRRRTQDRIRSRAFRHVPKRRAAAGDGRLMRADSIPEAAHRFDRVGIPRPELTPQPAHEHIDDVRGRLELRAPHVFLDRFARLGEVGIAHQVFEKIELARR